MSNLTSARDLQPYDTARIKWVPIVYPFIITAGVPFWPFHPDDVVHQCNAGGADCRHLVVGDIIVFIGLRQVQIRHIWGDMHAKNIIHKRVVIFLLRGRLYWTQCINFNRMSTTIVGRIND